jgi:hypothetical protein
MTAARDGIFDDEPKEPKEIDAMREFSLGDTKICEPPVSILALTWNAQSVRHAELAGTGNLPATWTSYQRYDPDFIPALLAMLRKDRHDLFVCALQEAAKPGCHLLSHALPTALADIGYVLVRRTRFMGVGKTTYQNLRDNGDLVARGLRLAVFARRAWYQGRRITVDEGSWPCPGVADRITHGKGATAISLHIPTIGRIGFFNCHLPFCAASVAADNATRIVGGVQHQAHCLRALIKSFYAAHKPHYMVVMGDMNFRMLNRIVASTASDDGNDSSDNIVDPETMWRLLAVSRESRAALYKARDELRLAIDYSALPPFCEGVDNVDGPAAFMPSGKMCHGRRPGDTSLGAYYFGHDNTQNPSWCDRILYARSDSIQQQNHHQSFGLGTIRCAAYDRFETGHTMTRSDHSAVVAHLVVEPHVDQREQTSARVKPTSASVENVVAAAAAAEEKHIVVPSNETFATREWPSAFESRLDLHSDNSRKNRMDNMDNSNVVDCCLGEVANNACSYDEPVIESANDCEQSADFTHNSGRIDASDDFPSLEQCDTRAARSATAFVGSSQHSAASTSDHAEPSIINGSHAHPSDNNSWSHGAASAAAASAFAERDIARDEHGNRLETSGCDDFKDDGGGIGYNGRYARCDDEKDDDSDEIDGASEEQQQHLQDQQQPQWQQWVDGGSRRWDEIND